METLSQKRPVKDDTKQNNSVTGTRTILYICSYISKMKNTGRKVDEIVDRIMVFMKFRVDKEISHPKDTGDLWDGTKLFV